MADDHASDALAQLRAELAAQEARFTAQIAALRAERRRPYRLPRRLLPLALVALLVLITPLATFAAAPFNDLTGGVHDTNIGLIYAAGITTGCVPNVSYCPTANVTREEMASFLARTAGLGSNPPVANAKTAQTAANATHAASADTATTATSAAQLGGVPAASYVQANNHFLPIAFGTIEESGTIDSGSGNFTVTRLGTGHYEITITGVSYSTSSFTTVATVIGNSGTIRTSSTRPALDIFTNQTDGVGADRAFQFVTYKP